MVEVNRTITIKAIVTRRYKEQLLEELRSSIKRIEMEIQQLEFQSKRHLVDMERQTPSNALERKQQIDLEKKKRCEERARLVEKIKSNSHLEIGTEVRAGTLQGMVNVEIGDDWDNLMNVEIVLQDGKVVEIRE